MNIVKAKKTSLQGTFSSSATTLTLKEFVDSKGNELSLADFGTWGVVVIKQGDTIEMVKFDGVTQSGSDTSCVLDVATNGRNLDPTSPYAGSSTGNDFSSGAEVIVTNDPLTMSQFANINNAYTWALLQIFTLAPQSSADAVAATELVRKSQLDAAVLGSLTITPVVWEATAGETVAVDQLVYLKTSDGEWYLADATVAAEVENVIFGITRGAGTDGNDITNGVTVLGTHEASSAIFSANTAYFASDTAGSFSDTAGTTEVSVGFAISTTKLYLYPRYNQQITEDIQDALQNSTSGNPLSLANPVVDDDDTTGTGSVLRSSDVHIAGEFGGDGSDGALSITSGTTTIDLGGADVYVLNYTSISITGTGNLAFSNPASTGTLVMIKCMGDVTITTSASAAIDLSGIGAAAQTSANFILDDSSHAGGNAGDVATPSSVDGGAIYSNKYLYTIENERVVRKGYFIACGSGGGNGSASSGSYGVYPSGTGAGCYGGKGGYGDRGSANGGNGAGAGAGAGGGGSSSSGGSAGAGGRGGGALIIECRGALNFTGTILASGSDGGNGTNASAGGGGAAGMVVILYKTLTANTGTITTAGGDGGDATGTGGTGGASMGGVVAEYI